MNLRSVLYLSPHAEDELIGAVKWETSEIGAVLAGLKLTALV